MVEKPFTLDSEAEALVELAHSQNKQLCVYHNRHFDGDFLTIKQPINDGKLGDIKRLESRFDRFAQYHETDGVKMQDPETISSGI